MNRKDRREFLNAYTVPALRQARACPFCGSRHLGVFPGPTPATIQRDTFRVICGCCQSAGPLAVSAELAVSKWNGDFTGTIFGSAAP
jgi:hypothetical protein